MKINLQNCINRQTEIDAHPKFWEKPEAEIIHHLECWLENAVVFVSEYSAKTNLDRREVQILDYYRKFIEIAQA